MLQVLVHLIPLVYEMQIRQWKIIPGRPSMDSPPYQSLRAVRSMTGRKKHGEDREKRENKIGSKKRRDRPPRLLSSVLTGRFLLTDCSLECPYCQHKHFCLFLKRMHSLCENTRLWPTVLLYSLGKYGWVSALQLSGGPCLPQSRKKSSTAFVYLFRPVLFTQIIRHGRGVISNWWHLAWITTSQRCYWYNRQTVAVFTQQIACLSAHVLL